MKTHATRMKKAKELLRWSLLIACIAFGLLYLNGAVGSWWASWGPPNNYPKAWEQHAIVWLGFSAALFFTGPMLFFALERDFEFKKSIYKFVWLIGVVAALAYPKMREFLLVDGCLDSGGKWSAIYFECKHE